MRTHGVLKLLVGIGVIAVLAAVGFFTRDSWLASDPGTEPGDDHHALAGATEAPQQVKLTPQAQSNLRLVSRPLKETTFWRTIQVPGMIVDRPAYSDRGIVSPVAGVVKKVHRFPGDTVKSGDDLFTVRLLSETLQLTQSDLFKTSQEIAINTEKKSRLTRLNTQGAISEATLIEIDNQARRLAVADKAYRQELQTRGLTPEQIDGVAAGQFVAEIVVKAPKANGAARKLLAGDAKPTGDSAPVFEVQDLKVDLGQQVQAGQMLALLSNHQALYIQGRAFRQETPLVEKAAREGWPLEVEFMEKGDGDWPKQAQTFVIQHVANTIDPASRTFAFYVPLANQARSFQKDDKTFLLWRFRPGQKVRLHLKVEKFDNVFVLPADAVVREGPEAFVFRQNGDLFARKPVRVVYEDRRHVVLANDGSVPPGVYVARRGASQLNRALKAQSGTPAGFHVHADGTVHANH
jgi:biotin carboxyl carrier protein